MVNRQQLIQALNTLYGYAPEEFEDLETSVIWELLPFEMQLRIKSHIDQNVKVLAA